MCYVVSPVGQNFSSSPLWLGTLPKYLAWWALCWSSHKLELRDEESFCPQPVTGVWRPGVLGRATRMLQITKWGYKMFVLPNCWGILKGHDCDGDNPLKSPSWLVRTNRLDLDTVACNFLADWYVGPALSNLYFGARHFGSVNLSAWSQRMLDWPFTLHGNVSHSSNCSGSTVRTRAIGKTIFEAVGEHYGSHPHPREWILPLPSIGAHQVATGLMDRPNWNLIKSKWLDTRGPTTSIQQRD